MKMPTYKEPTVEEEIASRQVDQLDKRSHTISNRVESMNAAGVEEELIDLGAEYKDRDGNCVAYGDMSMQSHVAEGEARRNGYQRGYTSDKKDF